MSALGDCYAAVGDPDLARACLNDYLSRTEALNRQPDLDLVKPYLDYFQKINA